MNARLLLEDGSLFTGTSFGTEGSCMGEVVFNTSMTGYQEILTDPSYCDQILTMTYPLIGNYGFSRDDNESLYPYALGLIVREHATYASNWRNQYSLSTFLKEHEMIGISGIDTRMLTRKLRIHGTIKGLLTTGQEPIEELRERILLPLKRDQVSQVSTKRIHISPGFGKRVVLMDFGAKHNIQREIVKRNCEVISVPYDVKAEEIIRFRPDGIVLSNGPGNPKDIPMTIKTIQQLLGKYPLFGICLGHQLLALACGADTERMKFGHRGGNHPVKEMDTGHTVITSQNHGYTVNKDSIQQTELEISHISLNDGTIEGLKHKQYPAFSVQYHPESAPGPLDSAYLFDRFYSLMDLSVRKGEIIHA